jgi:putative YhbY family RNA-binding protein
LTAITLNPVQRSALKGLAHNLDVTVHIGQGGASAAVLKEVDVALTAHGLIKVRVLAAERAEREDMFEQIADKLFCAPVQHIGKILILWRPRPQDSIQTQPSPSAAPVSMARSGVGRAFSPRSGDSRSGELRTGAPRHAAGESKRYGVGTRSSSTRSPSIRTSSTSRSRPQDLPERERRGHGAKPPERGAFSVDRTRNEDFERPRGPRPIREDNGSDRARPPRREAGAGFGSERPRSPRAPSSARPSRPRGPRKPTRD